MRHRGWSFGCVGTLAGLAAVPVQAVVASEYLSLEGAQKALFPQADSFREVALALSDEQRRRVAALAGPQPAHRSIRAFRALQGGAPAGYVFVDEVIGKEDFITYAVALDAVGRMHGLEVMAYRESHGGEI